MNNEIRMPILQLYERVIPLAFTLDVYGHVSERMQKDTANRMQEYLKAL